jgi:hypothetical protein
LNPRKTLRNGERSFPVCNAFIRVLKRFKTMSTFLKVKTLCHSGNRSKTDRPVYSLVLFFIERFETIDSNIKLEIANGTIRGEKLALFHRGKKYGYESCKQDLLGINLEVKTNNNRKRKILF